MTNSVGPGELRQDASRIVRDVEDGRSVDVTVNGRVAARLVPPGRSPFSDPAVLDRVFAVTPAPTAASWAADIDTLDRDVADPWSRGPLHQ